MDYLEKLKQAAYDVAGGRDGMGGTYHPEMVVSLNDATQICELLERVVAQRDKLIESLKSEMDEMRKHLSLLESQNGTK